MAVTFEKRIATNRLDEYAKLRDSEAWFTIHENGNAGSSPFDEAGFVKGGGGKGKVMYHFAVGVEGGQPTIVQIFPVNKRGKHAGNAEGNATSVAVETCQAPPGATSAPTQEALRELMYMLYTGDTRVEGIEGYTFSPDRTRGHKDWPGANPSCPATMKAKWGGVEPVVKAVRERLDSSGPSPTPKPSSLPKSLFGVAKGYGYDPSGPVSKLWLENGNKTGRFPRLVDVVVDGTKRYFAFSSGEVILADGNKPVVVLENLLNKEVVDDT